MTCKIHDYHGSAHGHVIRIIAFGSYILQLDNNNTCVSGSGSGLASGIESNSSTDTTQFYFMIIASKRIYQLKKIADIKKKKTLFKFFYRHYAILLYDYCIKKNIPEIRIADIKSENTL